MRKQWLKFFIFGIATISGCSIVSGVEAAHHEGCGKSRENPRGTKITTHSVALKDVSTTKSFYLFSEPGDFVILLEPDTLLRYLSQHRGSEGLIRQIKTDLPLNKFTDLRLYSLMATLEGVNDQSSAADYAIADMLEHGDATLVDLANKKQHGVIKQIMVAHVENRGGEWTKFCVNEELNRGWQFFAVADTIVD